MADQATTEAMRASRVLRALRADRPAFSMKLNLADARVSEIAARAGVDCVWLDMEHTANDWSTIQHQIMAAKIFDVDVVVRVARGSYSDYIRPLELDAAGIMVPHVMDAAEAQTIARYTKFHPLGMRPLDGGNADGAYTGVELPQYLARANSERFTIVQIEDAAALDRADEIAATAGVDMVFFGPGDFSQSIGMPGALDDPAVREARQLVAKTALSHGKFAGTVSIGSDIPELLELGYRFINIGSDVGALSAAFAELAVAARRAADT